MTFLWACDKMDSPALGESILMAPSEAGLARFT
jgi:hypothetical protein